MNHKIIRKVQHLIFVFFALFKLNINNEIRKKEYPPLAMVSPTRNDFRFVWPLNRPAAIPETTNKPGSVPRLVPSYNLRISPDKQRQNTSCSHLSSRSRTTQPLYSHCHGRRHHHSAHLLSPCPPSLWSTSPPLLQVSLRSNSEQ